ncbi:hypothetical protein P22_1351 [Propionispora sp. 2/2-37]|uniref:polysaccharide deacetylase family protein n=1 Tax=Propionispora sp. 2/2-37 TaxID=1677858 RepID=UPI0006BB7DE3|nr:polysaccharide deacetylase family protein [Propionispora sp. 2/2-37]CUH95281.1 hypothetical protein P22_1351 [Propionispora sp. 2/2-37]
MKLLNIIFPLTLIAAVLVGIKVEDHIADTADAVKEVATSRKVVALTFDDGPLGRTTPAILDILQEKQVKATFFVVGERAEQFPELVKREERDGHEIGNHTYSHPNLFSLTRNNIDKEIEKTDQIITKMTTKPLFFRPPEGRFNKSIINLARDKGYTVILWSVDPFDWRLHPAGDTVNTVLKKTKPGSIILLHDGIYPSTTPEALNYIIDSLKDRGYEFLTISQLLAENGT